MDVVNISEIEAGRDVTTLINGYLSDLSKAVALNPENDLAEDSGWRNIIDVMGEIRWIKQETSQAVLGEGPNRVKWVGDFETLEDKKNGLVIYKAKFRQSGIMGKSVDTYISIQGGDVFQASLTSTLYRDSEDVGFAEWTYKNMEIIPTINRAKITPDMLVKPN